MTVNEVDWSEYRELWWSDFRLIRHMSSASESIRKLRRMSLLAAHVLSETGYLSAQATATDTEAWLRKHGYIHLWEGQDIAGAVARRVSGWFDVAYLVAACHPNRGWTCLATATSDLGDRRWVFWDVVDGKHKYGNALTAGPQH